MGYGAIPGAPQYPNMTGFAAPAPEVKSSAENFYYGNAPDPSRPPPAGHVPQFHETSSGYEAPPSGITSPVYPALQAQGPAWNHQNPYPDPRSPPPNPQAAPGPAAPTQYYTSQPDPDPSTSHYPDTSYQTAPVMHQTPQYQPSAPPSAPEPHSPEYMQSPAYSTVSPSGPVPHPQAPGPPPQSFYYQQPQTNTASSAYPPLAAGQPGAYPEGQAQHQPPAPQPARPVEESLIEL